MMFFGRPGSTRAALLIESADKDGNPQVLIYHLSEPISMTMEQDYTVNFNLFDGASSSPGPITAKLTVQAYLADPTPSYWGGPMPEKAEVEPTHLAIESNESEIVIEEEDLEEWQRED